MCDTLAGKRGASGAGLGGGSHHLIGDQNPPPVGRSGEIRGWAVGPRARSGSSSKRLSKMPVVQNSSWARPASALHSVPHAIDWISLDFYRTNPTAWETPEQEYAAQVYPKMHPHQRALQVPQAFGRKHDACAAVCYMNASQRGCCKDNHGPGKPWASGQSNHTREWWDDWSATVATNYYSWAQRDPKIIGINPWYYGEDRGDIACGGYNVSVRQQPKAMARWKEIGVAILANA